MLQSLEGHLIKFLWFGIFPLGVLGFRGVKLVLQPTNLGGGIVAPSLVVIGSVSFRILVIVQIFLVLVSFLCVRNFTCLGIQGSLACLL